MSSDLASIQKVIAERRTIYNLCSETPVPDSEIVNIVNHAVKHVPSAFNTQSTRAVVLLNAEHEKLWDETVKVFEGLVATGAVPKEAFESWTKPKLASFRAGKGTVLFYEDPAHIAGFQEKFPAFKDQFEPWAEHTNAMHQYAVWLSLHAAGLGASLQHYNPVIDSKVAELFKVPAEWKLRAQLVFGLKTNEPGDKNFNALEDRVKVFGAQ
ncbi:nitroreductase [Ascosphaera apis ARSEF 7405]|uniref:Nitroreductase n=1 Tax=Ascosphaera apis ARSEF 7405 TaxID=392613 RepID=A0A168BUF9_9EURO|nr:nitroreductase [Ascosphaera apis ARSEF 7405]